MSFENVAFCDKATCSQRKVIKTCLTSCVNKSENVPISNSKLDADLGKCVLPRKEFDTGNV